MKIMLKILCVSSLIISQLCLATQALPAGYVKELSYRGGWVMFKVVGDDGINYCEPCPTDPGSMGSKRCWVSESKQVQISMILSAQARDKKIYGRVGNFSSSCLVYQMFVAD